jgi:hypothetical protein
MEFLKLVRRRSFLSEVVYTILNVVLAIALVVVIRYTESIPLAFLLVLVSKWRIFAVRPRYWFANLRSNLVDVIVGVSFVILLYSINEANIADTRQLLLMGAVTALHIAWLLVIKPRSKRSFVVAQAGVALFLGTATLFAVSYNWPVSLVVVAMWLIGYSVANHVLNTYDEETHTLFLSIVWGLVVAEISWVAYHWTIAYSLPFIESLSLPQVAIIVTLASFVAHRAYDSFYHHQKVRTADLMLPLLFSVSVIALLIFVFNRVGTTI